MADNGIIYIGMDLGTFKTAVASSNGQREFVHSSVGWPKDHVARAMLGHDVVFGQDAMDQRLALNVVRPFQKGGLKYLEHSAAGVTKENVQKHKEAAALLVEHAVSLTHPPSGVPRYGVIGTPSRASLENKQFVMEAAAKTFDAVVVVAEPFCVAYGLNCLSNALIVDIGAGTTDICPMYGAYPAEKDQSTLPIGGDVVDEVFCGLMRKAHPDAQLSPRMAREIKEKHGFVHEVNQTAVVRLPAGGRPRQFDVTPQLKEACRSLAGPIVKGVRELVARFDPEFQRSLLDNILLSGGGSQLSGLDRLLEATLEPYGGGNVRRVHDSIFAGADGALKLAMCMPEENWTQIRTLDESLAAA